MTRVRRSATLTQQRSVETRESLLRGAARVFGRSSFADARLRDMAAEVDISEGALYFHFGNKLDVAKAVLDAQQARMLIVLEDVQALPLNSFDKLFLLAERLAELVASDEIVQGGIKLSAELPSAAAPDAGDSYFEWVEIARALILAGVDDGSIKADADVERAAQLVNIVFVGAQVLAGLADSWKSLPARVEEVLPYVREALSPTRQR